MDFVGPLTGGNVTQTLPRGTGPDAGWHLVGNPTQARLTGASWLRPTARASMRRSTSGRARAQ
ncbi:MAG: hypothetical protein WKG07_21635 [Hymenobacter sp.]